MFYNNYMINKKDLINLKKDREYKIDLKEYHIENNIFLRGLKDVEGYLAFSLNYDDDPIIDYHLVGKMICPCAITNEDVEVDFDIEDNELIAFKEDDEGYYFPDGMEINDLIAYIISPEAPIKVVKKGKIEYPRGDGWALLSEAEEKKSKIDPRLAILKEYKFDKEEE